MAEIPSVTQVGGLIPNVWFDLIGRIVPGSYLILGLLYVARHIRAVEALRTYMNQPSLAAPAIGLLMFTGAAYTSGFLLGHASHPLIDSLLARPWRVKARDIDPNVTAALSARYTNWAAGRESEALVRRARDLCSYYIWNKNPTLAVIFGRWDSEALASESICTASIALFIVYVWCYGLHWALVAFPTVAVLAFLGYCYHRPRAIRARFDMFLTLSKTDD